MNEGVHVTSLSPEKKLQYIQEQLAACRNGETLFISCPYCGVTNTPADKRVCCQLFGDACLAVLDRIEKQEALDFASAVQERVN